VIGVLDGKVTVCHMPLAYLAGLPGGRLFHNRAPARLWNSLPASNRSHNSSTLQLADIKLIGE